MTAPVTPKLVAPGEGKEVTLFSGQKSTFRFNDRAVRLQDLREGMPVTAVYAPTADRFVVSSVTLSATQGMDVHGDFNDEPQITLRRIPATAK